MLALQSAELQQNHTPNMFFFSTRHFCSWIPPEAFAGEQGWSGKGEELLTAPGSVLEPGNSPSMCLSPCRCQRHTGYDRSTCEISECLWILHSPKWGLLPVWFLTYFSLAKEWQRNSSWGRCVRRGYLKSRIMGQVFTRGSGSGEGIQSSKAAGAGCCSLPWNQQKVYFVASPLTDELILGSIHPTLPWWTKELLFFATVGSIITVLSQPFPHLCCHSLLKQILQEIHPQLASPPGPIGFCAVDLNRRSSWFLLPHWSCRAEAQLMVAAWFNTVFVHILHTVVRQMSWR